MKNMEKYTIEYHKWEDIEKEICKEMGIKEEYFRDYHKIVGGVYKNLWLEWLKYFEEETRRNLVTSTLLAGDVETVVQWVMEDEKPWLEPFVRAVFKLWDEHNIEHIKYS